VRLLGFVILPLRVMDGEFPAMNRPGTTSKRKIYAPRDEIYMNNVEINVGLLETKIRACCVSDIVINIQTESKGNSGMRMLTSLVVTLCLQDAAVVRLPYAVGADLQ
jgi:hypothetical protein